MAFSRNAPAGLISKAFQQVTMNTTATLLNSTAQVGTAFVISVETQSVRMTMDGVTTPTATTGILLTASGSPYMLEGVDGSKLKFIRATSGAVLQVQSFKRVGDK